MQDFIRGEGDPITIMGIGENARIKDWLSRMSIKGCTINSRFSINVRGDVNLCNKQLVEIPDYIRFNRVSGNFWCDGNDLSSLKGCPKEVGGSFSCTNNNLTSFDHKPKIIKGNFWF